MLTCVLTLGSYGKGQKEGSEVDLLERGIEAAKTALSKLAVENSLNKRCVQSVHHRVDKLRERIRETVPHGRYDVAPNFCVEALAEIDEDCATLSGDLIQAVDDHANPALPSEDP